MDLELETLKVRSQLIEYKENFINGYIEYSIYSGFIIEIINKILTQIDEVDNEFNKKIKSIEKKKSTALTKSKDDLINVQVEIRRSLIEKEDIVLNRQERIKLTENLETISNLYNLARRYKDCIKGLPDLEQL